MEAIGYMLVYFIKGELLWMGIDANTPKQKYKKIANVKRQTKIEILCSELPEQFSSYMYNIKSLEFEEEPKYNRYSDLFIKCLSKNSFKNDNIYDFHKNHKQRTK
jgi:hypothetical protein